MNQSILDNRTTVVKDGDKLIIGGFTIEVISIPGHLSDSVVYRVGDILFTAGLVGSAASAPSSALTSDLYYFLILTKLKVIINVTL